MGAGRSGGEQALALFVLKAVDLLPRRPVLAIGGFHCVRTVIGTRCSGTYVGSILSCNGERKRRLDPKQHDNVVYRCVQTDFWLAE